jgi:chromate reductase
VSESTLGEASLRSNPPRVFDVAAIAGSLRRASYNRGLVRAAVELAPPSLRITTYEIGDLPFYNADVEERPPAGVAVLRRAVARSDALLIAVPEYNYGVPGVLKNAIDWLSRPARGSALDGKAAAILGASAGRSGTARGQLQLRQAFVFTNTLAMLQPELLIAGGAEKFDADGNLTDPSTRDHLRAFLERFAEFIARFVTR